MCLSPISIRTHKGRISVGCGKCVQCLQKRRSEWTFRLKIELRNCDSAFFITLTYDDENLPISGNLSKTDVQLFFKRLRKAQGAGQQLRYYLVGEYGEQNMRPHYHMIIFNLKPSIVVKVEEIWKKGMIYIGEVSHASIHYVTKYMLQNSYIKEGKEKPFSLMSRRPYLGSDYVRNMKNYHRTNTSHVTQEDGYRQPIPRIFRNKMYHKLQRYSIGAKNNEEMVKEQKRLMSKYPGYMERVTQKDKDDTRRMNKQAKCKKL